MVRTMATLIPMTIRSYSMIVVLEFVMMTTTMLTTMIITMAVISTTPTFTLPAINNNTAVAAYC